MEREDLYKSGTMVKVTMNGESVVRGIVVSHNDSFLRVLCEDGTTRDMFIFLMKSVEEVELEDEVSEKLTHLYHIVTEREKMLEERDVLDEKIVKISQQIEKETIGLRKISYKKNTGVS